MYLVIPPDQSQDLIKSWRLMVKTCTDGFSTVIRFVPGYKDCDVFVSDGYVLYRYNMQSVVPDYSDLQPITLASYEFENLIKDCSLDRGLVVYSSDNCIKINEKEGVSYSQELLNIDKYWQQKIQDIKGRFSIEIDPLIKIKIKSLEPYLAIDGINKSVSISGKTVVNYDGELLPDRIALNLVKLQQIAKLAKLCNPNNKSLDLIYGSTKEKPLLVELTALWSVLIAPMTIKGYNK